MRVRAATATAALLVTLAGAGCVRTQSFADTPVAAAELSDFVLARFVPTAGPQVGTAHLHFEEPDGTVHELGLSAVGFVAAAGLGLGAADLPAKAEYDLSAVDDPHGDDLIGPFDGLTADAALFLGAGYHALENDAHAVVKIGGFELDFGMDLLVGQEWLTLDVAPERDCANLEDDDSDGLVDCDDDDCASSCPADAGIVDAGIVDAGAAGGEDAGP